MPDNKKKNAASGDILFIQVWVSDQQRDLAGMDHFHRGIYESLRFAYFQLKGPLPASATECYRLAGAVTLKERRAVAKVLAMKFEKLENGTWHHQKCQEEVERVLGKSLQARTAAKKRWDEQPKEDADASADACAFGDANHKPLTSSKEHIDKKEDLSLEGRLKTTTNHELVPGSVGPNAAPPRSIPQVGADIDSIHSTRTATPGGNMGPATGTTADTLRRSVEEWQQRRANPEFGYASSEEQLEARRRKQAIADRSLFAQLPTH